MTDLPEHPDGLTPKDARNVPPGDHTDLLCAEVMGRKWRHITYDQPKMRGRESPIRKGWRVSRLAQGAHQARKWLREQGIEVDLRHDSSIPQLIAEGFYQPPYPKSVCVSANDEHLATARLLLLLNAKGVL